MGVCRNCRDGAELENKADTADLAVTPQSPVSLLHCSFCLFGSCWGEKTVKLLRKGLQVATIPLPSIREWESELDIIMQDEAIYSIWLDSAVGAPRY